MPLTPLPSQRRGRAWFVGAAVALVIGGTCLAVAAPRLDGPATVDEVADRGESFQSTDTLPPPDACDAVAVIGDSLMDNAAPWLREELRDRGYRYTVDAQPSRRIPASVREPYSGVKAVNAVRASAGEFECWMIALGSNDLIFGAADPIRADAMIDELLGAVTPGARVWWVNVNYGRDPRTSFDFPAASRSFNAVLDERAAASSTFTVIDWYSLSAAHPEWFFDPVHVDRAASIERARFTVAMMPPPRS